MLGDMMLDISLHAMSLEYSQEYSHRRHLKVNQLNTLCLCMILCICIGCMGPDSGYLDESLYEDISLQEFIDKYGTRIELPSQAYSIYVYSCSTIDTWDVRVVMNLPVANADAEIAAIQRRMGWMRDGVNQVSNKIKVVPVGKNQSLRVLGWPDSNDAPFWWRSITMKDYKVIALGTSNSARYVWLYNDEDHKLAMWGYYSDIW